MRKKRPKIVAIFSTKLEEFFEKKNINIFNLPILNCLLFPNFKIVGKKKQNAKLLATFFEKIK